MLPTLEDLVAHEELRAAIERTRNPAIKPEPIVVPDNKKRFYVCLSFLLFIYLFIFPPCVTFLLTLSVRLAIISASYLRDLEYCLENLILLALPGMVLV